MIYITPTQAMVGTSTTGDQHMVHISAAAMTAGWTAPPHTHTALHWLGPSTTQAAEMCAAAKISANPVFLCASPACYRSSPGEREW